MTKNPPHLPNKACRVDTYYRLQNVKWLLLFALLAFISGASAAAIIVSWVLPTYNQVQIIQTTFDNRTSLNSLPESLLIKQVEQRMLSFYDVRFKISDSVYPDQALFSKAIIVSSDGWVVLLAKNYVLGEEKNWEILDDNKNKYNIEKLIFDDVNHLLYIKIRANGLRVLSFFDWQKMEEGFSLWSVNDGVWQKKVVSKLSALSGESFDLLKSWPDLKFSDSVVLNSFLLSGEGELIGIIDKQGFFIPSWFIEYQIDSLLELGQIKKISNIWQGNFVKIFGDDGGIKQAFFVEKTSILASPDTIGVGDLILSIDGKAVDKVNLSRQVWLSSDVINFSVWRDGQELSIFMPKSMFLP